MIFNYIKADSFFRDYLPHIKCYKHKIRGKNGRCNPVTFTEDETRQIKAAFNRMGKDLFSY